MSTPRLIVRVAPDGSLSWLLESAAGDFDPVQRGDLAALRASLPPKLSAIDVLVPSEAVLLLHAVIPARSQARLRQALPFAVEEHLLQPVEQYHLALGQSGSMRNQYLVAAVDREQMAQWVDLLAELPVAPRWMLPDVLALPSASATQVWCEADRTLVRHSQTLGFAGSGSETAAMLTLANNPSPELTIYEWAGATDWQGPRATTAGEPLTQLAQQLTGPPPINLLQAEFSGGQERIDRAWHWLRYAAIVAALAIGVELVNRGLQAQQARTRFEQSVQQSEQLFRDTFPEVSRVVNARAQMQQQLVALGGASADNSFLGLLQAAAPALADDALTIEDLNYRNGALELRVAAANYQRIERVSQQLQQRSLRSAVEQVMQLGDASNAQLRISSATVERQ